MKKPTMAITAMPPATDIPMIGPMPRPPLSLFDFCVFVGVGDAVVLVSVLITVTVTSPPLASVDVEKDVSICAEVDVVVGGGGGVLDGVLGGRVEGVWEVRLVVLTAVVSGVVVV
jgi:hypothetical protein